MEWFFCCTRTPQSEPFSGTSPRQVLRLGKAFLKSCFKSLGAIHSSCNSQEEECHSKRVKVRDSIPVRRSFCLWVIKLWYADMYLTSVKESSELMRGILWVSKSLHIPSRLKCLTLWGDMLPQRGIISSVYTLVHVFCGYPNLIHSQARVFASMLPQYWQQLTLQRKIDLF